MRWLSVRDGCDETCIRVVLDVLQEGGIIIYPTDTVYGLGADAENRDAVLKVYRAKGRDYTKPLTIAVSDIRMVERYAILNEISKMLLERFLPGKVTFILPKTTRVLNEINPRAIGIRIPDFPMILKIIKKFDRAITATSANRSGSAPKMDPRAAASEVEADLILDYGTLPPSKPSTVVDLTGDVPLLVREGDVPFELIMSEYRKMMRR